MRLNGITGKYLNTQHPCSPGSDEPSENEAVRGNFEPRTEGFIYPSTYWVCAPRGSGSTLKVGMYVLCTFMEDVAGVPYSWSF